MPERSASPPDTAAAKRLLRAQVIADRARLTPPQLAAAAGAVRDAALAHPALAEATSVVCYVSIGSEPGTGPLLDALHARGVRVLLPVLCTDLDLDWAPYGGPGTLVPAGRGLLEPRGPRLGPGAVASAGAVLVPGLAAGRDGARLGRGGGSYDRALARVPPGLLTAVILHDGELRDRVPTEDHDRRVGAALTPRGWIALA